MTRTTNGRRAGPRGCSRRGRRRCDLRSPASIKRRGNGSSRWSTRDDAAWTVQLAACPAWSVRDVVALMVAVAPRTGRADVWRGHPPTLRQRLRSPGSAVRQGDDSLPLGPRRPRSSTIWPRPQASKPPLGDITAHEHDVRGAIGRPGAQGLRCGVAFDRPATREPAHTGAAAGDGGRRSVSERAEDPAEIVLHTSRFEALRWRTGRRSRAQLAAHGLVARTRRPCSITCTCSAPPTPTSSNSVGMTMGEETGHVGRIEPASPAAVDRATFQAELDALRIREKAHTSEGDAIAAARRRLPMVEVDPNLALTGPRRGGPPCSTRSRAVDSSSRTTSCGIPATRRPSSAKAAPGVTTQVAELSYLHSRDITYAVFCQGPV